MAAELVEVRGDIAYLKTSDRIEHIPLARLSAADVQYLASRSPSLVYPGPADDSTTADALPAPANTYNAAPPDTLISPVINEAAPAAQAPQPLQRESQKPLLNSVAPTQTQSTVRGTKPRYTQTEELLPSLTSSTP